MNLNFKPLNFIDMLLRKKLQQGEAEEQFNALNHQPENNDHIANYNLENNGQLPPQPMFEKHPYLDDFELQDFDKYIIGTFPPISYIYDHPLIVENGIGQNQLPQIPFFHGNDATFWKCFLDNESLNELNQLERNLKKGFLISYLSENQINYCDIIKNVRRSEFSTEDKVLYNLTINEKLINHILNNTNDQVFLNFNTSTIFNTEVFNFNEIGILNDNINPKAFNLFLMGLQQRNYAIKIDLLDGNGFLFLNDLPVNHCFKIFFKLLITDNKNYKKEFFINTTPSPSKQASRGMGGNIIFTNWKLNQPINIQQNTPTIYFRKHVYNLFRNNYWDALQAMNVNL